MSEEQMKSTKAMRDRIRELMPKAWDDYDRAVDCVLEDFVAMETRIEALEAALRDRDEALRRIMQDVRRAALANTHGTPEG